MWTVLLTLVVTSSSSSAESGAIALVHATVIDGTGSPPLTDWTLLIRDGRIAEIGPSSAVQSGTAKRIVDATGRFVLPGLWDAHTHTEAHPPTLDLYLAHGVTSLRDMGCDPECTAKLVEWRSEVEVGTRRGPRLLVAGPNVDGLKPLDYAGHVTVTTDTAAAAVADLAAAGVDFVKVRDWLSEEEYEAVVAAARAERLPVDGHLGVAVRALHAVESGQRTFEHGGSALGGLLMAASSSEETLRAELLGAMDSARSNGAFYEPFRVAISQEFTERLLRSLDETRTAALAKAFATHGTALVPTLVVSEPAFQSADPWFDGRRLLEDEDLRFIAAPQIEAWRSNGPWGDLDETTLGAMAEQQDALRGLVARMRAAGAPILAGTDLSEEGRWQIAGHSLHNELLLLVEAGLSPMEALVAATSAPAEVFGLDDLGTLQTGQRADLVVLDADPLVDIRNVRRIVGVMSGGAYLDRSKLDSLLESVATRAE